MTIKAYLSSVAKTSAMLAATSISAIAAASYAETGSPYAAINSISHIVDGDDVAFPTEFASRGTTIGIAVNATAMASWAVIFEFLLGKAKPAARVGGGVAMSVAAFIVDYYLVPKRYTPGIERHLSKQAIFWIYVVLALTFAASANWNKPDAD